MLKAIFVSVLEAIIVFQLKMKYKELPEKTYIQYNVKGGLEYIFSVEEVKDRYPNNQEDQEIIKEKVARGKFIVVFVYPTHLSIWGI